MQVQCKIYEEWLEVMSDYSTVFCDDRRGVAEHYYGSHSKNANNGTSEEGNDKDGSSTVRAAMRLFHLFSFLISYFLFLILFFFYLFL